MPRLARRKEISLLPFISVAVTPIAFSASAGVAYDKSARTAAAFMTFIVSFPGAFFWSQSGRHMQQFDDIGLALERPWVGLNKAVFDSDLADWIEHVGADTDLR